MKIWALADLHLAISVKDKSMDVFGAHWNNYMERILEQWSSLVASDDYVLVPGDITWAMKLEQAREDLAWIDQLPGKKLLLKGNHDYWWGSLKKMREVAPPSIDFIQNNAYEIGPIAVTGSRLWDSPELDTVTQEDEKIFERELVRLENSLKQMSPKASYRICLTHYPPIGADLKPTRAHALMKRYQVDLCCFGHLHGMELGSLPYGHLEGIDYRLVSADYVEFKPLLLKTVS